MEWWMCMLILVGGLILLLTLGIPVAFSFWIIVVIGLFFFGGGAKSLFSFISSLRTSVAVFTILPVPFFIMMGDVLFQSGIGGGMLDVLEMWLTRLPGRLSFVSVGAGVLFAALSGSSLATTAMLGSALEPEMRRRGYRPPMIVGPILAGGSLAVIIPPSILLVLLGGLGRISVAKLLVGGIVPGILLFSMFIIYISVACILNPSLAPSKKGVESLPLSQKIHLTLKMLLPALVIIFLVMGTIFLGVCTPTEAAALGAFGCFVLAFAQRSLNWAKTKKIVMSSARTTALTLIIVTGSMAFSQLLSLTGVTREMMEMATGLAIDPLVIIFVTLIILMVMGCFVDQISMLMIGVPIFVPLAKTLGFDPIWYGVLYVIAITVGFITPPFGMLLFVIKGVIPADISMATVIRSAIPYVIIFIVVMIILLFFPQLTTWLPGMI